ncbi:csul [Trypoxylus dichotomus]
MSCGLQVDCPVNIQECLLSASNDGYHFIVTNTIHPNYTRFTLNKELSKLISRTDRILTGNDWNRLIVGILSRVNVDSEVKHIQEHSKKLLSQELGFTSHLGLPAVMLNIHQRRNSNLAQILYSKFIMGTNYQVWITLPMVHPTQFSPICTENEREDSWEWWNDLRRYCNFDKRLGLALEMPESEHMPTDLELQRWAGEPVKAVILPTHLFKLNQHKQPVLPRVHQDVIQKFLSIDVQYIIKGPVLDGTTYRQYNSYIHFLGKKLYQVSAMTEFVKGCEDYLQNPLQPLTEHLETMIYEVFERDQVKYVEYQRAIQKALEDLSSDIEVPIIMVVGAGRGPLVQATINASLIVQRKVKIYAVEKNPYAINTLEDRVQNEWGNQVILVNEDMRTYNPPEMADILVSELLGSFGDNELSPECLDGAQRFLKLGGISIPCSYSSFLAPFQSTKIFNEIRTNRPHDKTLESVYETPYVVHLVNYYQIAQSKELFTFTHPNWDENRTNERYKSLTFTTPQNCVLTGFLGFFETVLYKDVTLSINPQTHSTNMVSWFPIVFPLHEPVQLHEGNTIQISFWRSESADKVWYEWCLEAPVRGSIMNPNGRSYFIKKH